MGVETRQNERYEDIGRIESTEICPLAGVLDNISSGGLKVHYSLPVVVDLENDYNISVTFARDASNGSIELLCHPQWVKEENGITEIGFKILPSKGSSRLSKYIEELGLENMDSDLQDQIANSGCNFI